MVAEQAQIVSDIDFLTHLDWTPDRKTILNCMQCGICSGSCPLGHAMEFPPRQMILQARAGCLEDVLRSPSLWMCVGCYMCSHRCPRAIELTDELWPALRDKAMQIGIQPPPELQDAFHSIFKYGNSIGESPRKRMQWADGLNVPVRNLAKAPAAVDVLCIMGDYPAYYPRNQIVARGFAQIMARLGIEWGVLGNKERTIGDCERLYGEEGLFESLVEYNRELFDEFEFDKIVMLDPHSVRAMEKFYPHFGVEYQVEHYTSFLAKRIEQIEPLLVKPVEAVVTYHDNCCVGRRCGLYEAPRALLEAIPGIQLVEMAHHRDDALCCGGAGGGMWLDAHIVKHGGERLGDIRIREAATVKAEILAVSCPFELSRFEDSAKVTGLEDQIQVRDIIELLVESMGLEEGGSTAAL